MTTELKKKKGFRKYFFELNLWNEAQILPTHRHGLNIKCMNNYSRVTTTADVSPLSRCELLQKLVPELAPNPKPAAKAGAASQTEKQWHCKPLCPSQTEPCQSRCL